VVHAARRKLRQKHDHHGPSEYDDNNYRSAADDDDSFQYYDHDQHQYYNDHYPFGVISCLRSGRRHRHH